MLYKVVLISTVEQCESDRYIYIYIPLPLEPPFHHPTPLTHHRELGWAPCVSWQFPTGDFTHSIGEDNGTPLQYSCLENPMDRGAWWAAVHGVTKSWTGLSDFTFTSLCCIIGTDFFVYLPYLAMSDQRAETMS